MKSPAMPTFPRREKSTFAGGAGVTSKALDGEGARAIVVKKADIDVNIDGWCAARERRRDEGMVAVRLAVTGVECLLATMPIAHRKQGRVSNLATG